MSEENGVTWLCQRCGRRQDIELETDPVLLRVCDSCKIENWTRPVKGVVEAVEPETVEEELVIEVEEPEPLLEVDETKEIEIAKLKAQLAELEK